MRSVFVLSLMVFCFAGFGQIINFSDPKFKNALVNTNSIDTDGDGLGDVDADVNNDGEIDLIEALNIKSIILRNQDISNVNEINLFQNLEFIDCTFNNISNLQISELIKLKILFCSENQLTSLDLHNLDKLERIHCSKNKITKLELINPENLIVLNCINNLITELIIKNVPALQGLNCNNNLLQYLDVSSAYNLYQLECVVNKLEYLNLKNGTGNWPLLFFANNPDLTYICCDEHVIDRIRMMVVNLNLINCEVNTYCTFSPGGTFYTVTGKNTFSEKINDCVSSIYTIPYLKYYLQSNTQNAGIFISKSDGTYRLPLNTGMFTVFAVLDNPESFKVTPASYTFSFPTTSDTITQNFCITPKEPNRKVDITIIPLSPPARPGFNADYKIIWENKGNLLENGTIHFSYDENIFDYVDANQTPDAINSGKLSWDYTDLLPFEKREVTVTLNLNSPMENPPVNAGDITYLYANILDNVFRLENVIVGSYDPNDKTCLQGQYFHPDSVGKYVDFLIRFENTGNFDAENVVVKDIIDTSTFDVSSLLITDASHEVYTRIAANKVEFIFENIQLPFEDEANDGYVAFKVKTKSTLILGDSLKNLADIYFDYNFPIRTNETFTTVAIPSSTKDIQTEVTIHPNPVRDVLTLDSNTRWTKAEMYDISGRLIKVTGVDGFSVDVDGLESGTYILHLSDKDKRGKVKFVKM
ncbi:MAG: T9SS type A sorting domain-containing protein [Saprospiraceae bacterium]|nr:T9SS type A sorting domain-containing protein [Saprospiraceae bacterium]